MWPWLLLLLPGGFSREFSLKDKSIYFIVVDRFARDDASNVSYCDETADWVNNTGGGYCGGTLNGIANHLDYIQGMGFDCIWITPVVESNGYMGYDAVDLWKINRHFGSQEDLRALSKELHRREMCLVLDIVVNHMRPLVVKGKLNLSLVPFDQESHYNQRGLENQSFEEYLLAWPPPAFDPSADNENLRNLSMGSKVCGPGVFEHTECACFPGNSGPNCPSFSEKDLSTGYLGVMGDLNHSHPFVRQTLLRWVKEMVQNYSLDALRLDTAIYLERDFLPEIQAAAGVEILGEATVNNLTFHASLQGESGVAALLNFPPFYHLPEAFCGYRIGGVFGDYSMQGTWLDKPNLWGLGAVLQLQLSSDFYDHDLLGNFADNHDEYSRLAHYCKQDTLRIQQALVWVMTMQGIPIVYYGTEQGLDGHQSPSNTKGQDALRESLWQTGYRRDTWQYLLLRKLNRLRRLFGSSRAEIQNFTENTLVFTRADAWVFLNNAPNTTQLVPQRYCPGPEPGAGWRWIDALSEEPMDAYLAGGCFDAPDKFPKVLVQRTRAPVLL
ncbi:unnamed protein product [Effrenium voratum]|nr:unnamed protein product [Effrenium voratum]